MSPHDLLRPKGLALLTDCRILQTCDNVLRCELGQVDGRQDTTDEGDLRPQMSMLIEQQDEVLTVIETNTKDTAQEFVVS